MATKEYKLVNREGKHVVQIFNGSTEEVAHECVLVRDVNGWRPAGAMYDTPQHKTPELAARHYVMFWSAAKATA